MFSSSAAVLALAFAPSALATVFMTSPVATTTCTAGQQCTLSWKDDNTTPLLPAFGAASVGVFAGSQQEQTLLQEITDNVNVATTNSIIFTPTANIGPNGNEYFIKFASLALKANGSNFPVEAFSAKFTLAGMTGQFNASVQSQIAGATGASTSSGASSTGTGSSSASGSTTSKASSSGSSTGSASKTGSSTSSSSSSTASSGAERLVAGSAVGAVSLGAILLSLL